MLKVAWPQGSGVWRILVVCESCGAELRERAELEGLDWRERFYDGPRNCSVCGQLQLGLNTH